MAQTCRHGIDMNSTCSACGRFKVGSAGNFESKKHGFLNSISRLEDTVRKMQAELTRPSPPPTYSPPEDRPEESDTPPPAPPPQRYPWQRG